MGWLGSSRSTTTTTTTLPPWVEQIVRTGVDAAQTYQQQPFTPYTHPRVAGLDPLQAQAATMAANGAGIWGADLDAARAAAAAGAAPTRSVTAPTITAPTTQLAATASAGTGADHMSAYFNPYLQAVLGTTLNAIDERAARTHADLGTRLAGANAYGGSREAILRGEIERDAMRTRGEAAADVAARGFETAAQYGTADANRLGETSRFNAGAANDMARFYSQLGLDAQQIQGLFDIQAQTANQDADENAARRSLESAGLFADIADQRQRATHADATLMNLFGAQGREAEQQGLDAAYEEFIRAQDDPVRRLQLLLQATTGAPLSLFSSQTTTQRGSDPSGALGGIGSLLTGIASIFGSDSRLKRDAVPRGRDKNGVRWWTFRYVWDPPGVRRVGVMAQELLAMGRADAVLRDARGFLMVDYARL